MHDPYQSLPFTLEIDELVDEYLSRKQAGEQITIEQFANLYESQREEILKVLPVVDYLEASDPHEGPEPIECENLPQELLGEYKIIRIIGFGGMGTVYEAEDFLRSRVALKVMSGRTNKTRSARFEREAKIVASLHHSNIVPVFNYGSIEQLNYMSMRLIDGPNLAQVLCAQNGEDCHNPRAKELADQLNENWEQIAEFGFDVADALAYAHRRGVLHRDIKPANLIVDESGRVWVTDFGLAKFEKIDSSITQVGQTVGTLRYMAPEQLDNESDVRSDLYSLGMTLYELVHGKDGNPTVYSIHPLQAPSQSNPNIPGQLERIILKACSKDPEERYQTADEMALDLARFCGSYSTTRNTPPPAQPKSYAISMLGIIGIIILLSVIPNLQSNLLHSMGFVNEILTQNESEPAIPLTTITNNDVTGIVTLTTKSVHSADDAEEWLQGKMYLKSSDLELTWDEGAQDVGMRFVEAKLPQHAKIISAFVQFTCDESDIGETNLKFYGERSADSKRFSTDKYNITSRAKTDSFVEWNIIDPWESDDSGDSQKTPDLATIVQELVNQKDWTADSPVTILISGKGKRTVESVDGWQDGQLRPQLVVAYQLPDSETE